MPAVAVELQRRAAPMAGVMTMSVGLALYQLTSLALGPVEHRELHLSFDIPSVDVEQLTQPVIDRVDLVLGSLAPPPAAKPVRPTLQRSTTRPIAVKSQASQPTVITVTETASGVTRVPRSTDYHDADARSLGLARRR